MPLILTLHASGGLDRFSHPDAFDRPRVAGGIEKQGDKGVFAESVAHMCDVVLGIENSVESRTIQVQNLYHLLLKRQSECVQP